MKPSEYAELDATALAVAIRRGEISPAEAATAAREAIAAVNADVNAVVEMFDEPLSHRGDGPFAGVPFAIKDLGVHAANVPFSQGSRFAADIRLPHDTELMSRFRRAGFATVARSTSSEFGLSPSTEPLLTGATRNPWDLTRTVGGSSGGSAALVATGALPIAHGGDGGGSLRTPASCCGLVGLKPSRGRTPVGPDVGEAVFGLAVDGVVTRTVRDTAAALDAIGGAAPGDRFVAPSPRRPYLDELATPPGRLRIALAVDGWFGLPVEAECAAAVTATAEALAELGHDVAETCFGFDLERFVAAVEVPFAALQAAALDDLSAGLGRVPGPGDLEALTLAFAESGRRLTYTDFHRAAATFNDLSRTSAAFFADADVLLTPTLARPPVPLGHFDTTMETTPREWIAKVCGFLPYGMLYNVTGQPAITLPLGQTAEGLPIGVQAGGRFGDEATLLRLAAQLEQALPWRGRRPAVYAANRTADDRPGGNPADIGCAGSDPDGRSRLRVRP